MATLIKYLDLGEGRYILNDKIYYETTKSSNPEYITWDELWLGVIEDIKMIEKYVKEYTQSDMET